MKKRVNKTKKKVRRPSSLSKNKSRKKLSQQLKKKVKKPFSFQKNIKKSLKNKVEISKDSDLVKNDEKWWKTELDRIELDKVKVAFDFKKDHVALLLDIPFTKLLINSNPYVRELLNLTKKQKIHGLPSCVKNIQVSKNNDMSKSSKLVVCTPNAAFERFEVKFTDKNSVKCEDVLRLFHCTNLKEFTSKLESDKLVVIKDELFTHTFPFWTWGDMDTRVDIEFENLPKNSTLTNRYTTRSFTNKSIPHDTITIKGIVCKIISPVQYNNDLKTNIVKLKCVSLFEWKDNYEFTLHPQKTYTKCLRKEYAPEGSIKNAFKFKEKSLQNFVILSVSFSKDESLVTILQITVDSTD